MLQETVKSAAIPVGVVVRRTKGVTKWAKHVWRAVAVVPGAKNPDWKELRRTDDYVDFYATTKEIELHRTETEAYRIALTENPPALFVVLRDGEGDAPLDLVLVTASPFEAQDYADSGEEMVEKVPMPETIIPWVQDFVTKHHEDDVFIKRKRDKKRVDLVQDGIGDARIRQTADVYRAPAKARKEVLQ